MEMEEHVHALSRHLLGRQGGDHTALETLGKHLCKSPDGFSMVLIYGL